jgi:hypothetical protein
MKTGNKILLVFLGSIVLIMLVGAIDWRLWHNKRAHNAAEGETRSIYIENFSCIRIKNIPQASINNSDTSRIITYLYKKGGTNPFVYSIIGDTLIIEAAKNANDIERMDVLCKNKITVIQAENSNVNILMDRIETLDITLLDAKIYDVSNNSEKMKIDSLHISASDHSLITFNDYEIKKLDISASKSDFRFMGSVGIVSGVLKDQSELNCRDAREIQMKRDKNCKFRFY